jgi:hypothetical protein
MPVLSPSVLCAAATGGTTIKTATAATSQKRLVFISLPPSNSCFAARSCKRHATINDHRQRGYRRRVHEGNDGSNPKYRRQSGLSGKGVRRPNVLVIVIASRSNGNRRGFAVFDEQNELAASENDE